MTPSELKMFNMVSQNSHWLAGYAYGFTYLHFFGFSWIAFLFWVALTSWKELYYDERYETPEIRGNSWVDLGFYNAGLVLSFLIHLI